MDVLLVFQPARSDYLPLFTPVLSELRRRGVRVGVMLPPASRLTSAEFGGAPTLTQLESASLGSYVRARAAFWQLERYARKLAAWLRLDRDRRKWVDLLLQNYCWHRELVRSTLHACTPQAVLGLHFMSDPGILGGIELYRKEHGHLRVVLQQHGVFSHNWATHDFHGADLVLLWGRSSEQELRQFAGDVPPASVVGNPKLEAHLAVRQQPALAASTPLVLFVGTNGEQEREHAALSLVARCLGERRDLEVVYRPHPSQSPAVFDALLREGLIAQHQVQSGGDVYQAVAAARVVLGTESTVLPESVLLGVPAIQLLNKDSTMSWTRRGMLGASDPDALSTQVSALVTSAHYRESVLRAELPLAHELLGDPVGAASRIADSVQEAIGAAAGPTP